MNRFLTIFIFPIVLTISSCQSASDSGPCEYDEEKFNMTIIEIKPDPSNENHMMVMVDFDGNVPYADEIQNFENVRPTSSTTTKWVENNKIRIGNIYTGIIYSKVEGSGDCDEEVIDWNQKFKD